MVAVMFLLLVASCLAVGFLGVMMFLEVAWAGPQWNQRTSPASRTNGTLGQLDGAALALGVEAAVSRAASKLLGKPVATAACEVSCREDAIVVTTPEVLAIVDELRAHRSPAEIMAIRASARRNLAAGSATHDCPLLLAGGFCACDSARPVACRTRCLTGADSPAQAELLAKSVGSSATDVLRGCLRDSGLDDSLYELNYALVQALDTRQVAQRWAQGEHVLQ